MPIENNDSIVMVEAKEVLVYRVIEMNIEMKISHCSTGYDGESYSLQYT